MIGLTRLAHQTSRMLSGPRCIARRAQLSWARDSWVKTARKKSVGTNIGFIVEGVEFVEQVREFEGTRYDPVILSWRKARISTDSRLYRAVTPETSSLKTFRVFALFDATV
jgi:hypothetical protein